MSTAQLRGQTFPHELFQYAMHNVYNQLISLYVDLHAAAVFMWCVCVFAGICLYYWFDWEHC